MHKHLRRHPYDKGPFRLSFVTRTAVKTTKFAYWQEAYKAYEEALTLDGILYVVICWADDDNHDTRQEWCHSKLSPLTA